MLWLNMVLLFVCIEELWYLVPVTWNANQNSDKEKNNILQTNITTFKLMKIYQFLVQNGVNNRPDSLSERDGRQECGAQSGHQRIRVDGRGGCQVEEGRVRGVGQGGESQFVQ